MASFKLNRRSSFPILLLALAFEYSKASYGNYVRRVEQTYENNVDQDVLNPLADDGTIQGIQGGSTLQEAIPWYAVYTEPVLCGGVVVHSDIVLTTARCVNGAKYPTQVRIGSLRRGQGGTVKRVTGGRIHPNWNGIIEQGFDVAVLKLSTPVNTSIANLNSFGNVPANGQSLFTLGFDAGNGSTVQLQGLNYNYIDRCQERFPRYNPTFFLCADASAGIGTCPGDAGSPIVLNGTNTVVGLNSFSNGAVCGQQTVDIYTRINTYQQWIVEQICSISSNPPSSGCPTGCLLSNLFYRSIEILRSFDGF